MKVVLIVLLIGLNTFYIWIHFDNYTAESERYVYQEGIVVDKQTKLEWMSCYLGQQWSFSGFNAMRTFGCNGNPGFYYNEDLPYLKDIQVFYSDENDWRIPTQEELETIVVKIRENTVFNLDGKSQFKLFSPNYNNIIKYNLSGKGDFLYEEQVIAFSKQKNQYITFNLEDGHVRSIESSNGPYYLILVREE